MQSLLEKTWFKYQKLENLINLLFMPVYSNMRPGDKKHSLRKKRLLLAAAYWQLSEERNARMLTFKPPNTPLATTINRLRTECRDCEYSADGDTEKLSRLFWFSNARKHIISPNICAALRVMLSDTAGIKDQVLEILYDIVGNPFNKDDFKPMTVSPFIRDMAKEIYDNRANNHRMDKDRMAVMADALEEEGCTNANLLAHLRSRIVKLCEHCKQGKIVVNSVCGLCGGRGYVSGNDFVKETCQCCDGTGTWVKETACIRCHGTCTEEIYQSDVHVRGCWAMDVILNKA